MAAVRTGSPAGRTRRPPSRAYRLRREEPLGKGVARIAHGRISHALDELGGATESSPEEAVREARKDAKKLRALLRLVSAAASKRAVEREDATMREIGRSLAGVRDADSMLATLGGLDLPAETAASLGELLTAHRSGLPAGEAAQAVEEFERLRDRVRTWTPRDGDFAALRAGLEASQRLGRRALRTAWKEPTADNLHEWRRRAKDSRYQLSVLRDLWPPVMDPLARAARRLCDQLGEHHDLTVLLEFAGEHDLDTAALAEVVDPLRADLRAEAFSLGARLYAEKPRALGRRVEALWDTWRAGGC